MKITFRNLETSTLKALRAVTVFPAWLRHADMKDSLKIMMTEIISLTGAHGYCFARNKHFEDLLGVSTSTVKNYLTELKDLDMITVKFENHDKAQTRMIYPRHKQIEESYERLIRKQIQVDKNDYLNTQPDSQTSPQPDPEHPARSSDMPSQIPRHTQPDSQISFYKETKEITYEETEKENIKEKESEISGKDGQLMVFDDSSEDQQIQQLTPENFTEYELQKVTTFGTHHYQVVMGHLFPDLQGMKEPLTQSQLLSLLQEFPAELTLEKITALDNSPKYHKGSSRKKSAYRTVLNWCKMEVKRNASKWDSRRVADQASKELIEQGRKVFSTPIRKES